MKNYAKLEILVQRELSEIEAYAFFMRLYDLTFTLCIICCILHGTFNVYLYIHWSAAKLSTLKRLIHNYTFNTDFSLCFLSIVFSFSFFVGHIMKNILLGKILLLQTILWCLLIQKTYKPCCIYLYQHTMMCYDRIATQLLLQKAKQ